MDTGALVKSWNLQGSFQSEEELLLLLSEKIIHLWNDNPTKLMNTLYRLDVSEEKVQLALNGASFANDLARLIIEREKQKVISRG